MNLKIVDLNEDNIDDLIYVCSYKWLSDPKHQKGIELKKKWLLKMIREFGVCAKIAYLDDRPVGQMMFGPETSDPTDPNAREGVLYLQCIFVPFPEAQRKGVATALLNSLIEDCRERPEKLGLSECKFIVTHAFDTGLYLSQADFFRKRGFKNCPDGEPNDLYLPISGEYEPKPKVRYEPLKEDANRAVIMYGSACQFGYVFAMRAYELIREVAPDLMISLTNVDERPEEARKRAGEWLIVNARPIRTWVGEEEEFKKAVLEAIRGDNHD